MSLQGSWARLILSAAVGVVVAVMVIPVGAGFAAVAGWIATAATFCAWTWLLVAPMDADATREHATREDPGHLASVVSLTVASVASLGGVAVLLVAGAARSGAVPWEALLGVASVVASWTLVHTVFAMRYARLYFDSDADQPIDFNGTDEPDYHDFAYLAFTLGMTYQVSDTDLNDRTIRRTALRHSLLSFLLGAVVIACTINLVVQLASGG